MENIKFNNWFHLDLLWFMIDQIWVSSGHGILLKFCGIKINHKLFIKKGKTHKILSDFFPNKSQFIQQFLAALERAKELDLGFFEHQDIPTYLDWLSAPLDFDLDRPRFLKIDAYSDTIIALVDAVREVFNKFIKNK